MVEARRLGDERSMLDDFAYSLPFVNDDELDEDFGVNRDPRDEISLRRTESDARVMEIP